MMPKFPFFTAQQLNLDWVMHTLKKILSFMPIDKGAVGDVLQRKASGAAWEPLAAASLDIHGLQTAEALADDDEIPMYDKTATGNRKTTVAAIRAGVASPVTSVNGQTGAVVLDAADVGALPDTTTIPTKTSDLTNDSGFITSAQAPVQSVNGQTGSVVVNDVRYFDNYSNGYYSNDDDLTVTNILIQLAHTPNKKCIEIHGSIEFTTGATSGWKTISLYQNANLDVYDFVLPSSDCIRRGCVLILDENDNIIPRMFGTIIIVRTTGVIDIRYNQDAAEPTNTKRTLLILSREIQTAL